MFGKDKIKKDNLKFNYRSTENIIKFNNAFFEHCAEEVQRLVDEKGKDISSVYAELEQYLPKDKKVSPGYVEVSFIDIEEEDFYDKSLDLLPQKVELLLEGGYSQKDIAVLVRGY